MGNFNKNRNNLRVRQIWRGNTRRVYYRLVSAPWHRPARRKSSYCRRQRVWVVARRLGQHRILLQSSANSGQRRSTDSLIQTDLLTLIFKTSSSFANLSQPQGLRRLLLNFTTRFSGLNSFLIVNPRSICYLKIYWVCNICFVVYYVHFSQRKRNVVYRTIVHYATWYRI